jgi:hypothetical protein
MFSKTIIDSDAFLDMPMSSQALYFHLAMRADDDGFINNPKRVMRTVGANQNDLDVLAGKRYILGFESGVIVIKHWKIHNYIQRDRYKPTVYLEEKEMITIKGNKAYTEMDTECIQDVRLGKVSIDKDSIEEDETPKRKRFTPPTIEEAKVYCEEIGIDVDAWYDHFTTSGWRLSNGNAMKDWKASVRTWKRNDDKWGAKNTQSTHNSQPKTVYDGYASPPTKMGNCQKCGEYDGLRNGLCPNCR